MRRFRRFTRTASLALFLVVSVLVPSSGTCFPCHEANVEGHDFVFTRYAP